MRQDNDVATRSAGLRSKAPKYVLFALLAVLAFLVFASAAIYVRLTQGPMSIEFLRGSIEQAVAAQMPDLRFKLGDAFLAIDPKTHTPRVSFRNIIVADAKNNLIASAPQAALNLDPWSLLQGKVSARNLDLIGPSISVRRNVDGSLVLGFNTAIAGTEASTGASTDGVAKPAVDTPGQGQETTGGSLLSLLDSKDDSNTISALREIRISDAQLRFYDDSNAATWFAPSIDLTYEKKPYGFVILARGDIATNAKPWHGEVSATYTHDDQKFEISTTLDNVIPATAARKIFALSKFATVTTPLSGHVEMALASSGKLISATGEFQAAQGAITLPDYFAQPIAVDQGIFHVVYAPETDIFNLDNSTLKLGGRNVALSGSVQPLRSTEGQLSALAIKLVSVSALDAQDTKGDKQSALIDRVEFSGKAGVDKAQLEIEDFVVLSGGNGLRMRGNVAGGEASPAIHLAGRVRDINLDLLKVLWPPIVAPRSREWLFENVKAGTIPEGTFQVNFAENQLAEAREKHRNPVGSLEFRFSLKDVETHYYKSMPDLVGASGQGHVQDNSFNLDIDNAAATLANGDVIKLRSGSFDAEDLQTEEVQAKIGLDLEAPLSAMIAVASSPDIKMINQEQMASLPKASGNGSVKIQLQMPLIKDPPKERVQVKTDVALKDATVSDLAPGVDLTNGDLTIAFSQERIDISGPAKLNGQPAKISWSKPRDGGEATAQISAILDEKSRNKLGLKLDDYVAGPIPVDASLSKDQSNNTVFDIKADLSQATMRLATLSWQRPPTPGTVASFKLTSNDQGRSIHDFKLDGDGLHLKGAIELFKDGKLKAVSMSEIKLDEDNVFSVRAIPGEGTTDLTITGSNLDARPYIKTILAPPKPTGTGEKGNTQDFTMRAHFDKVIANRGEVLSNVTANLRARGGRIAETNITGSFVNGQPLTATVVPLPEGRQLKVRSPDAGSTLRAANFYSKIAGGLLDFSALIGNEDGSPMRNGILTIKGFDVRNEATLAELDKRGKPTKSGPRAESVSFELLNLPFSADEKFIRFKDGTIRGSTMCATTDGVIRKSDNALDISGTVVPACGLSRALNNVPIIGDLLSGGNYNEGIFGVTYAMGGTLANPQIQLNPLSALAPGIFRRLFDFGPRGAGQ